MGRKLVNQEAVEPKELEKKRTRKTKKMADKEILNQYFFDQQQTDTENDYEIYPKTRSQTIIDKNTDTIEPNKRLLHFQYLPPGERKKFDEKFTKPKNSHQDELVGLLKNKQKKIIFITGPAGTGKTMFATEYGISNFLKGVYDKIIFTRPSVSVDEELGFLPGTLEEKMAPWIRPIYDILYQFVSPKEIQVLMEEKTIEIAPLGFMRGRTFKNTWIVADEMQNSTVSQMKMLLTRLGENSRLIITGDLEQFDLGGELNGLGDFLSKFRGKRSESICSLEFDRSDIQREEVVKEVLEIYCA
jgi:phosphate starvation-inducible PhoH-like protein